MDEIIDIDIEIMSEKKIIEAVDLAVQNASRGNTAMFDFFCRRAKVNYPYFTANEITLQRALERVRASVTG